ISVLHGSSIGGGLLLSLATDHRIATESAIFRLGVAPHGLSPIVMATRLLPSIVGYNFSMRMYAEDTSLSVQMAIDLGLVNEVFND
ncbi:hypothetical protein AURANDRAFT_32766, partial [Aureococcus anophagefferens]